MCGYTITAKVKLYIELYYYSIELKVVVCRGALVSMTTLDVHSEAKEIEGIRDFFDQNYYLTKTKLNKIQHEN